MAELFRFEDLKVLTFNCDLLTSHGLTVKFEIDAENVTYIYAAKAINERTNQPTNQSWYLLSNNAAFGSSGNYRMYELASGIYDREAFGNLTISGCVSVRLQNGCVRKIMSTIHFIFLVPRERRTALYAGRCNTINRVKSSSHLFQCDNRTPLQE